MLLYAVELSHVQSFELVKYGVRNMYPGLEIILNKNALSLHRCLREFVENNGDLVNLFPSNVVSFFHIFKKVKIRIPKYSLTVSTLPNIEDGTFVKIVNG